MPWCNDVECLWDRALNPSLKKWREKRRVRKRMAAWRGSWDPRTEIGWTTMTIIYTLQLHCELYCKGISSDRFTYRKKRGKRPHQVLLSQLSQLLFDSRHEGTIIIVRGGWTWQGGLNGWVWLPAWLVRRETDSIICTNSRLSWLLSSLFLFPSFPSFSSLTTPLFLIQVFLQ